MPLGEQRINEITEKVIAATGKPICLLINFGKRVEVKRFMGTRPPMPV